MSASLPASDRIYLRDLACQVADIAANPRHDERRSWWIRHNRLEPVKPMVLVFPEGSWEELLPKSTMRIADPFWQEHEWYLRYLIYRWEHLRDDNTIEPYIRVHSAISSTGYGIKIGQIASPMARGAWKYDPPLKSPDDVQKLQRPQLTYDPKETARRIQCLGDVFGDILEIRLTRGLPINTSLVNMLCRLRGLDQVMMDMVERPAWLHDLLEFLTTSAEALLDEADKADWLTVNNGDDYVGSGGVAYTDELPQADFTGIARLKDRWGFAESQEYTGVSPEMYHEFGIQYQARLLERFGLNCYGCCEDMTQKLDVILEGVPHLQRLSISPFTDVRVAAERLQKKVIYSWKPDPAMLAAPTFDPEEIKSYLMHTVEICEEYGCVLEMILKDTHTCLHKPERFDQWVEIAQEVSQVAVA